jgi:hypothetical protein
MNGVIEYYEAPPPDYKEVFCAGLICRVPIPFVLGKPQNRILLDYQDIKNPANCNYRLENTDLSDYDPRKDKPLRHLNLDADSFLLANGYKFRPCVILSDPIKSEFRAPGDQGFLVVPLYSVHDPAGAYKDYIDREMVMRAQAYQFNNIFYMPESSPFDIRESFARVDRIEFVKLEHFSPKPVKLTAKAIDLLRQWAWYYQGCPILDNSLEEYMAKARTELDARLGAS